MEFKRDCVGGQLCGEFSNLFELMGPDEDPMKMGLAVPITTSSETIMNYRTLDKLWAEAVAERLAGPPVIESFESEPEFELESELVLT